MRFISFCVRVCGCRVWACSLISWSTAQGTDTVWWSCKWREVTSGTPCVCLTKMSCRLRDLSVPSLLWWRYKHTQTYRNTTTARPCFTLKGLIAWKTGPSTPIIKILVSQVIQLGIHLGPLVIGFCKDEGLWFHDYIRHCYCIKLFWCT